MNRKPSVSNEMYRRVMAEKKVARRRFESICDLF